MGKYMRKCKGAGEVAVMEVGPLTRARTLALALAASGGKRRKVAGGGGGEFSLRGRRMPPEKLGSFRRSPSAVRTTADPGSGDDLIAASRCSSNGSCDLAPDRLRCQDLEAGEVLEAMADLESKERRERTPSSEFRPHFGDMDSSTTPSEANSGEKRPAGKMPSEAEIEAFFAAAEDLNIKRFVERYNYDVKKDIPLEGRYEWAKLI